MVAEMSSTPIHSKAACHTAQGKTTSNSDVNTEVGGDFSSLLMSLSADPLPSNSQPQQDGLDSSAPVPHFSDVLDGKSLGREESLLGHEVFLLQSVQMQPGSEVADSRSEPKYGTGLSLNLDLEKEVLADAGRAAGRGFPSPGNDGSPGSVDLTPKASDSSVAESALEKTVGALSVKSKKSAPEAAKAVVKEVERVLGVNLISTEAKKIEMVGSQMPVGMEIGLGGQNFQTTTPTVSAAPDISPGTRAAMSPDKAQTQTQTQELNYWIGREVQSAELKLEGPKNKPIEVSVSLRGNEARVEFRTESSETQQVIEGGVPHLRGLLENEGLVLSSVSVGSAGAQANASTDGKSKHNPRRAVLGVLGIRSADEASSRGPNQTSNAAALAGRSVDLFI